MRDDMELSLQGILQDMALGLEGIEIEASSVSYCTSCTRTSDALGSA